jgi:uncharacterized membrane protein
VNPNKSRWTWWLVKLSRRIWFRALFLALMSVAGALLGVVLAPLIPPGFAAQFGADAVTNILEILASSMLIVATFSLSTAISAYAAASSDTTPRVTELLMQDPTAQNALSTFVGGFLFSLVGIIGLSAGIYGEDGHLVLFALTLLMVLVIVVTFLRWVEVLSNFGRVPDAIDRTAEAADDAVSGWVERPYLGGRAADDAPETDFEVYPERMGYVRHIDIDALQTLACEAGGEIVVSAPPGAFLDDAHPIARTTFEPDDAVRESIRQAYDVADNRTFDQDPKYGISAMAEIGIKALSPAVNDPVTAIRVIDRLVRVLRKWGDASRDSKPHYDRVYVPALDADELFTVAFTQLALYGAKDARVGVRLQQAFSSLSRVSDADSAAAARTQADRALGHAKAALVLDEEYARLRSINKAIAQDRSRDRPSD